VAYELDTVYSGALTPYAVIRQEGTGLVWDGSAFVAWAGGDFADYAVVLADLGGGYWAADMPAGIGAGAYTVQYRERAGVAPVLADDLLFDSESLAYYGGGVSTAPPAAAAGMTLSEARAYVGQFARNAGGEDVYSLADKDRAIRLVGEQFCRVTRCLPRVDAVALTAGSAVAPVASIGGAFRPERLVGARLAGASGTLALCGWDPLQDLLADRPATGKPAKLAFEDPATANVYPTPDANYTVRVRWWQPFTSWTPGVASVVADGITLNVPADLLAQILPYGPPAVLQHNVPEHRYASESWRKYLAIEAGLRGANNLGVRVFDRNEP
jgi:hypothetical protein